MKKSIIAIMLTAAMAASFTACGGSSAPAGNAGNANYAEEDYYEEEDYAGDYEGDPSQFTLLDVSTDMIQSGLYAKDDYNNELVVSIFTGPDGVQYVSFIGVDADGTGDLLVGSTANSTVTTDDDGYDWVVFNFDDVYTGKNYTLMTCEPGDGTAYITEPTGSMVYTATYLTAEETITYMGSAVALLGGVYAGN